MAGLLVDRPATLTAVRSALKRDYSAASSSALAASAAVVLGTGGRLLRDTLLRYGPFSFRAPRRLEPDLALVGW
jgi:hypothetical protein